MNRIKDKINQQVICQHHHKMTKINTFSAYQKNEKKTSQKNKHLNKAQCDKNCLKYWNYHWEKNI